MFWIDFMPVWCSVGKVYRQCRTRFIKLIHNLFSNLAKVLPYRWHFLCSIDANIGELFAGKLCGIECLFPVFKYELFSRLFAGFVNILLNYVRFFFALHLQAA